MSNRIPSGSRVVVLSMALILLGTAVGTSSAMPGQDQEVPNTVPIAATLSADMSAESSEIVAGESVTVTVEITNEGDSLSPAPVFRLDALPEGWSVDSWSGSEATYRESTNEWLWTSLRAGESKQLSINLVTTDAADSVEISGEATDGEERSATVRTHIGVRPDDRQMETATATATTTQTASGTPVARTTTEPADGPAGGQQTTTESGEPVTTAPLSSADVDTTFVESTSEREAGSNGIPGLGVVEALVVLGGLLYLWSRTPGEDE